MKMLSILLILSLALAPVSGFSELPKTAKFGVQPVQTGGWENGAELVWQCSDQAKGFVRFAFKLPDGTELYGMFSCGEQV